MDYETLNNEVEAKTPTTKSLMGNLMNNFKNTLKKRIWFVVLTPIVLMGVVTINYYYQYQLLKNNPQKIVAKENKELVAAISKLIILPEGEEPTIATVSDPEKLKGQLFFAKAQKGDKVLIYTNTRKAILYSPESNKIVEVAPLNIGNPTSQKTSPEETNLKETEN